MCTLCQMFVHMIVLLIAGITIHVTVVYANEMPLFFCNIEIYIKSTINY